MDSSNWSISEGDSYFLRSEIIYAFGSIAASVFGLGTLHGRKNVCQGWTDRVIFAKVTNKSKAKR
jgi:hypothetical protein